MAAYTDKVIVNDLVLDQLILSPAPWKPHAQQLAFLTVTVYTDTSKAGETDNLEYSISYANIAKQLRSNLTSKRYIGNSQQEETSPRIFTALGLAEEAAEYVLWNLTPALPSHRDSVTVEATLPEALLHGGKLQASVTRCRQDYDVRQDDQDLRAESANLRQDSLRISDFTVSTILGLNDIERLHEQPLVVDIETWPNSDGPQSLDSMAYCAKTLQETVWKFARSNHPLLLEKFCPDIAGEVISKCNVPKVRVRLDKPKAVLWTSTTAVEVTRHRSFFQNTSSRNKRAQSLSSSAQQPSRRPNLGVPQASTSTSTRASSSSATDLSHTAYIAIGSNVGNKAAHINRALKLLDDPRRLYAATPSASPVLRPADAPDYTGQRLAAVVDTSLLYESKPMYVTAQDPFLNGVCKIKTCLSPTQLLGFLKSIEKHIGRRKTIEKGPREIDLDLLIYDDIVLRDDEVDLTVPHPAIAEREFVLRPLNDIAPSLSHPVHGTAVGALLADLANRPSELRQVTPLASTSRPTSLSFAQQSKTYIMSILNVTPDSFSDGGRHFSVKAAVAAAAEHVCQGADILDVGGVSTRPGSEHVNEDEELRRVLPVIRGIRDAGITLPISVDTYRASVARESIEAGADIINDISGGMHDPLMLETVADLDVPFVLMHMRGKPEEVNQPRHQEYENNDVVAGVSKELAESVRKALQAGIKRWNIILDPGIGFSKNKDGNLQLLRNLPAVTGRTRTVLATDTSLSLDTDSDAQLLSQFPVLVGTSRKGFIGKITAQPDPTKREYANAAIHALAIANGANIIRVHDVAAARDVVSIASAIYDHL